MYVYSSPLIFALIEFFEDLFNVISPKYSVFIIVSTSHNSNLIFFVFGIL